MISLFLSLMVDSSDLSYRPGCCKDEFRLSVDSSGETFPGMGRMGIEL